MDQRITTFLRGHHVMTLATWSDGGPWCANVFYACMKEDNLLVFISDLDTRHGREMELNPHVAASIALETKVARLVRGVQIEGVVCLVEGELARRARGTYIRRFPYAFAADMEFWFLRLTYVKLTDNRLGFGKKIIWNEP